MRATPADRMIYSRHMTIRALVFDFDGLILDTETPEVLSWREIYAEHGYEYPKEIWSRFAGIWPSPEEDAGAWLQRLSPERLDLAALRARQRQASDALTLEATVMDGVLDFLEAAKGRGLRLAIASSSGHDWVDLHLQRLGLMDTFEVIVCGDDVDAGRTKPVPDLYLKALRELHAAGTESIAFEDSPTGVQAAHVAGLYVVAVPNPVTAHLEMPGADLIVRSLSELSLDGLLDKASRPTRSAPGTSSRAETPVVD